MTSNRQNSKISGSYENGFNVGNVVSFALSRNPPASTGTGRLIFPQNRKSSQGPMNPELKQRHDQMRDSLMGAPKRITEKRLSNLLGMAVHQSISDLCVQTFPVAHITISDEPEPARLWDFLRREGYKMLLNEVDTLALQYPQADFLRETLLHQGNLLLVSFLKPLCEKIFHRIRRHQKLQGIMNEFTRLVQETSQFITYNGNVIHFKPDWVFFAPEALQITDFKTGFPPQDRTIREKDLLQLILFAWCTERIYKKTVSHIAIHYLKNDQLIEMEYTEEHRAMAKNLFDQFLSYHNLIE